MDHVALRGLKARGHHGVFPREREEGQTFIVDLVLGLDTRPAAAADDLATGFTASVEAFFNLNKEGKALNVNTGQPGVDHLLDRAGDFLSRAPDPLLHRLASPHADDLPPSRPGRYCTEPTSY